MRKRIWVLVALAAVLPSGMLFARAEKARPSASLGTSPGGQAPERAFPPRDVIPPYHSAPPKGPLAPTLPASQFINPLDAHCYAAAARIKPVLYQLPCYCGCDREVGHTSLLSCYQDEHAVGCATCKMELYYAYQQTRKGNTPAQIRQGIIRGDWKKVDLAKWPGPGPARPSEKH